jgi:Sulfotransferase domain
LIVGEASPSYLFHPLAPERVRTLVPEVRLIAVLRNPIDRALSHYNHEIERGTETLPFEEALDAEEQRMEGELERMLADPAYFSYAWWNFTYLSRGRYAEQLERWFAVFPREQLLVVSSTDLLDRPAAAYAEILSFLGARPHELDSYPRVFGRQYAPMAPATHERLAAYYEEPNRRLYRLLGRDLGWT